MKEQKRVREKRERRETKRKIRKQREKKGTRDHSVANGECGSVIDDSERVAIHQRMSRITDAS